MPAGALRPLSLPDFLGRAFRLGAPPRDPSTSPFDETEGHNASSRRHGVKGHRSTSQLRRHRPVGRRDYSFKVNSPFLRQHRRPIVAEGRTFLTCGFAETPLPFGREVKVDTREPTVVRRS